MRPGYSEKSKKSRKMQRSQPGGVTKLTTSNVIMDKSSTINRT